MVSLTTLFVVFPCFNVFSPCSVLCCHRRRPLYSTDHKSKGDPPNVYLFLYVVHRTLLISCHLNKWYKGKLKKKMACMFLIQVYPLKFLSMDVVKLRLNVPLCAQLLQHYNIVLDASLFNLSSDYFSYLLTLPQ